MPISVTLSSCICLFSIYGLSNSHSVKNTATDGSLDIGVLIPWNGKLQLGRSIGAAVPLAIKEIENRGILPKYTINWEWRDTHCEPLLGLEGALQLWENNTDLDAFIGAACSGICKPVALMAAAWNLPYVSFGCTSVELSSNTIYPTFTRSVGTWVSLAPMLVKFVKEFGWKHLTILTDEASIWQTTANAVKAEFEKEDDKTTIEIVRFKTTTYDGKILQDELRDLQSKIESLKQNDRSRIILALMYDHDLQNMLLSAYDEKMMRDGYVFISFDSDLSNIDKEYQTEKTKLAYEGLISAHVQKPEGKSWDDFSIEVRDTLHTESKFASQEKINKEADKSEVDVHAGMLYDAILLWAYGVNKTIQDNATSMDDGRKITKKIQEGINFDGMTGKVHTNTDGDRTADYKISIADKSGEWVDMYRWDSVQKELKKVYKNGTSGWTGITWPGNKASPPIWSDECRWKSAEDCYVMPGWAMVLIVIAILLGICVLVLLSVWKQKQITAMNQMKVLSSINWSELTRNKIVEQVAISRGALKTPKSYSALTEKSTGMFTDVADYKGKVVAIKNINRPSGKPNDEELLKEMKVVHDMDHMNINKFIGVITESPHVSILWDYAVKGSVQDVIQNSSINCSWQNKLSVAVDIAKGMQYLHNSKLKSHGHLTSANCVIDGKWICKITDYGMATFKSPAIANNDISDLLWTAPELLRQPPQSPYGTPKGDVYSYGIILQEVILQDAPFGSALKQLGVEEIVEQVKSRCTPPVRPIIQSGVCNNSWIALMEQCWNENPIMRPTFSSVISKLREINGGQLVDVMDNMVGMMENQAEALEENVAELKWEITQERKKVQTVLKNLLPRGISEDLTNGKAVDPEEFNSTTILICSMEGFENIIDMCNPSEIIEILSHFHHKVDEATSNFDTFRVDTCNDGAMIVSGAPDRNGDCHAAEICNLALFLEKNIRETSHLQHISYINRNPSFRLLIGIHTGNLMGGLIGSKLPRYCMFGESVVIAQTLADFATTSEKIHISATTANLLPAGNFHLKCRGATAIRGKEMTTFWLTGKEDQ